jgi:hypothetical protein
MIWPLKDGWAQKELGARIPVCPEGDKLWLMGYRRADALRLVKKEMPPSAGRLCLSGRLLYNRLHVV